LLPNSAKLLPFVPAAADRPRVDGPERRAGVKAPAEESRVALVALRDARSRKWCARWLRQARFEVVLAEDGAEALTGVEERAPSVLVVDGGIRLENGLSVCAAVRGVAELAELPVVAVCFGRGDFAQSVDDGATHVIPKPVNWQLVAGLVESLVEARELAARLSKTTQRLEAAEQSLEIAWNHIHEDRDVDGLTRLPNRSRFENLIERAVAARAPGSELAVLYLDLDHFKAINEIVGREGGNRILQQVAERLRDGLRAGDLLTRRGSGVGTAAVGRLSGDEFTVLLTHVEGRGAVRRAAQGLLLCLAEPFVVGEKEVHLSATVGAAISAPNTRTGEVLLQRAELALCEAKRQGGGMVRFYEESMESLSERNLDVHRMVKQALKNDELQLHYQPLIDSGRGRIVAAEALLRWYSPELGAVPPDDFLPAIEGTDLMLEIGEWVLRTACLQHQAWAAEGLPPIRMAVNVAPSQLRRSDLAALVERLLRETGIDPGQLELELSERGVLRDDPQIRLQLESLNRLGVRLSVDDFGTGQSAIDYLKQFPLHVLKIDRSYVADLTRSHRDAGLTLAMVDMAHSLRLAVVAEGVETQDQRDMLQGWGCDELQGFLFSPAVCEQEFREMLKSGLPSALAVQGGYLTEDLTEVTSELTGEGER
jgi:diguanylate cyclase (GGDEF)-like protein